MYKILFLIVLEENVSEIFLKRKAKIHVEYKKKEVDNFKSILNRFCKNYKNGIKMLRIIAPHIKLLKIDHITRKFKSTIEINRALSRKKSNYVYFSTYQPM